MASSVPVQTSLPDRLVHDFAGVQRNFEQVAQTLTSLKSSLVVTNTSAASLLASVTALSATVATKVASVTGINGVLATGTTAVNVGINPAVTSSGAVPSSSNLIQLTGYRNFNLTTNPGGTTGSPLLANDSVVEVYGTVVATVFLPTASGVAGKIYEIRNNRQVSIVIKVGSLAVVPSLGSGSTARVVSTGVLWRHISTTPGGKYTNSTTV